jgi:hypothetical protein
MEAERSLEPEDEPPEKELEFGVEIGVEAEAEKGFPDTKQLGTTAN